MGRTIEAYSIQMKRIEERLRDFQRGLRKEDRTCMEELLRIAFMQVQSGVMASNPNPLDSMLLSMLIHIHKENKSLRKELQELKEMILPHEGTPI